MALIEKQHRAFRAGLALAWAYPLLMVSGIHVSWLCASVGLGHWARPSIDDPLMISSWATINYYLAAVLFVTGPGMLFFGIYTSLYLFAFESRQWRYLVGSMSWLLGTWAGVMALFYWDPLRVADWFFD